MLIFTDIFFVAIRAGPQIDHFYSLHFFNRASCVPFYSCYIAFLIFGARSMYADGNLNFNCGALSKTRYAGRSNYLYESKLFGVLLETIRSFLYTVESEITERLSDYQARTYSRFSDTLLLQPIWY